MLSSAPMLAAWLTFIFLLFSPLSFAQTSPTWTDCFSGQNNSLKLDVSTVYAQISENESFGRHLSLTLLGMTPQAIQNLAEGSSSLSTLFTTTDVLTFNLWFNSSAFCGGLRPASPLPSVNGSSYCPLSPGPFAFSSVVPLNDTNELLTLQTRLRAVDSLSNELLCVDVDTTPLSPGVLDNAYGHAKIIFWSTIALAAAFWLIVGGARLSAAWGRRAGWSGRGVWSHVETLGFVVASAVSGEAFAKTPALLRFGTPSMRDIFFHTQWCAAIGMVAVQWPQFVYPLLTQAGWATLSYNITVAQPSDRHWNPLSTPAFQPPSNFADQLTDQSSPLFINTTAPNLLYTLPAGSASGLESWAYTIGLYPQDMFGVCMSLFLGIIAGIIILSLVLWAIDTLAGIIGRMFVGGRTTPGGFLRSPRYSSTSKEMLDAASQGHAIEEDRRSASGNFLLRSTAKLFPNPSRHHWPRIFPDFYGSFHFSVLHGNLVRILILFHLPVTIFSSYHMTIGRGSAPLSSIILAACSLVVFSIVIPVFLVARLSFTSTNKLYDETRTLLSLGPLYNHYRQGSQFFASLFFATNVAFGVTIGCGQKSGTAQAVVILVIEVISALFTSVWLPWGHGASMGLISFLFCVARIVVAVLLIIMTPTVSIGGEAGQWVAYVILFILGLVYLSFLLMLASKIIEVFVRIVGGAGFDSGRSTIDSGLLGACALAGCCGSRRRRKHRHRAKQSDATAPRPPSQPFAKPVMDVTPTPSGPPSVLRPEQALRPYKEDTDDESGYIMGAWHRPGYEAVANEGPSPRLESPMLNKSSGFSRVAGGRANFDAPYAIATGSTISFPSVDRAEHPTPTSTQRRNSNNSLGMPPASFTDAERTYGNLPPGAMAPHMRTKSQSAIIEHTLGTAGTAVQQSSPVVMPPRRQSMRPEIVSPDTEDDPSDSEDQRRSNRKWYQWKSSSRRHSEGDDSRPTDVLDDAGGPDGGRTFLGARKKRRASALEPLNKEEDFSTSDGPPKKSFVVVRPAVSGRSTPLLSTPGAGPSGSRS